MNSSNADTSRPNGAVSGWRQPRTAAIVAVPVGFALGAGTSALALRHPSVEPVAALTPAPIGAMRDWSQVALKGTVAEVFGSKFVVADDTGRALVDTGRDGEGAGFVALAETVTVQGRFERGFVHAASITHADGRNDVFGPPAPPPRHGLLSWRGGEGLSRWLAWHRHRDG